MLKLNLNKINFKLIFYFLILIGIIVYIHNFLVYPPTRGLDSHDHIAYINYLINNKSLPTAKDGLQMYQPPLYYFLASLLFSFGKIINIPTPLKFVQLISLFSAFGNIFLVYLISKKIFKDKNIPLMLVIFILFLPMVIYESVVISNEMFLSFLMTLGVYIFLINKWENLIPTKGIILGVLIGLACLTKYTGIFIFLSIIICLIFSFLKTKNQNYLKNILIIFFTVSLISGWFYIRQYLLFNNPLILANDPKLFPYWQEPGFRDFKFYSNLIGIIPLDPFGAYMKSFWGGIYTTVWIDAHHTFLPVMAGFSKAGAVIVYLALIPTIIILFGLINSVKENIRKYNPFYGFLFIYSLSLFISFTIYSYKLPFESSVKAFYLLGLVLPMGIFLGLGLRKMLKWLRRYSWVICISYMALIVVIVKLYWYQGWWKNIGE